MAHIGFLSQRVMGDIYPMSTLALHLKQLGHRITVLSVVDAARYYQSVGLEFVAVGLDSFPKGQSERDNATTLQPRSWQIPLLEIRDSLGGSTSQGHPGRHHMNIAARWLL